MEKVSNEISIFGDFDGMSVGEIRRMLADFSDDAIVEVREEKVRGWGENFDTVISFVIKEE